MREVGTVEQVQHNKPQSDTMGITTVVRTLLVNSGSHMFEICQVNEMIINLKTKCSYFQKYFFYLCFYIPE